MRFKRPITVEKGRLDITPLVDVIFLLLIFFLLSSPLASRNAIKVNLPKAKKSESINPNVIKITVTEFDEIYFNGEQIRLAQLEDVLRKNYTQKKSVLIQGDKNASLGMIVNVWDVCRIVGVEELSIATISN